MAFLSSVYRETLLRCLSTTLCLCAVFCCLGLPVCSLIVPFNRIHRAGACFWFILRFSAVGVSQLVRWLVRHPSRHSAPSECHEAGRTLQAFGLLHVPLPEKQNRQVRKAFTSKMKHGFVWFSLGSLMKSLVNVSGFLEATTIKRTSATSRDRG